MLEHDRRTLALDRAFEATVLAGELNDARPDTSVADVLMPDAPFTADPYES